MPEESYYRSSRRRESTHTEEPRASVPPPPSMPRGTPGKLAQEIHEEFLTCKICLDSYKNPKCLSCLHTFCEQCIDNHILSEATYKKYSDYRDFTCPLCRKRTQLPVGGVKKLPDNFLVSSLSEMVGRQKTNESPTCDMCKLISGLTCEANSKCLECNKVLCKACVELHRETKVTRDHSIFDCDIEKDVICKEHGDEVVRYYCEPCQTCVCVLCTFNEHRDHEVTNFQEAVSKHRVDIEELLAACQAKFQAQEENILLVARTEKVIHEAEQQIRDLALEYIGEVRQREKQLIEEIHNIYGQQAIDLISQKVDMETQLDALRSTCTLTKVVLGGKDIELLLLKKEVQEKLAALGEAAGQNLPETIRKVIKFHPGSIDLGYIQDMNRPIVTMRSSKTRGKTEQIPEEDILSVETQTEESGCLAEVVLPDLVDQSDQQCQTDPGPIRVERGIATDVVLREEKAVNTRTRSTTHGQTSDGTNGTEASLDADKTSRVRNRRRMRERAYTIDAGQGGIPMPDPDQTPYQTAETYDPYPRTTHRSSVRLNATQPYRYGPEETPL